MTDGGEPEPVTRNVFCEESAAKKLSLRQKTRVVKTRILSSKYCPFNWFKP